MYHPLSGTSEHNESYELFLHQQQHCRVQLFQTEGGTKNIDYTANGPAGNETNYVDATSQELEVAQGATVKVKIKGYEATQIKDQSNDDLRYCMGKAWMDFNGDKQFNPENLSDNPNEGECVVFFGQVRKGVPAQVQQLNEYTFQIPSDAKPGQSRLRLVFWNHASQKTRRRRL